jgi:hypothetical protein
MALLAPVAEQGSTRQTQGRRRAVCVLQERSRKSQGLEYVTRARQEPTPMRGLPNAWTLTVLVVTTGLKLIRVTSVPRTRTVPTGPRRHALSTAYRTLQAMHCQTAHVRMGTLIYPPRQRTAVVWVGMWV